MNTLFPLKKTPKQCGPIDLDKFDIPYLPGLLYKRQLLNNRLLRRYFKIYCIYCYLVIQPPTHNVLPYTRKS